MPLPADAGGGKARLLDGAPTDRRQGDPLQRSNLAAAFAVLILAGCASAPAPLPQPQSAPLKERSLGTDEKARYEAAAADPGVAGARAGYFLGLDQAAAGDWAGAGSRWQSVAKRHPGTQWDRLATYMTAEALERTGDGARAFVQYQQLLSGTAVADLPERALAACQRLCSSLDEGSLTRLEQGYALPAFQPLIRLRLLELDLAAGRTDPVRQGIDDFLRRWPQGPGLDRVEQLSRQLDASVPVDPRAVGLLIPQAGPLQPFGEQLRQGAQLAVDQANTGLAPEQRYRLIVADEGSDTPAAAEALRGLLDKDKVIAVLGPLSSDAAAGLLPLLATRRVPLFSPSAARSDLSEVSPWFFRNTTTPEKQALALADYLVAARKVTRVAVLAPDNGYGQALARAFVKHLTELGGTAPLALTYAPGTRDFLAAMVALGGVDPSDGKNAESDEKREQQSKVEEASTGLGRFLLVQAQALSAPAGVTVTPKLKVLVMDFAQDAAAAELTAGRAFEDRFERTLAQLDELDVQGPAAAQRLMTAQGLDPNHLTLPQVSALGQALGVDYVLGGATAEDLTPSPNIKLPPNRRLFDLVAQLVDPRKSTVVAQRRFTWSKYKAPPSNPLGLQALYVPSTAEDVARVLPSLLFFDLRLPLMGSDQWDRPELRDHLDALNGAIFTAPWWPDSPDDVVKRFDQAFRQAYAARPGLLSAESFDAASIVLAALKGGASDRATLRQDLSKLSGYEGVCGRTSFDGHQDAVKRPALVEVKAGGLRLIEER